MWDWFQPTLGNLTISWGLRLLKEVCKGTEWWSESLFFWDAEEVTAASFCLAALGLEAQGLLSLLLIRVCITPTGWTKSASVKCIY